MTKKSQNPRKSVLDEAFLPSSSKSNLSSLAGESNEENVLELPVSTRRRTSAPVASTEPITSQIIDGFNTIDFSSTYVRESTLPIVLANEFIPLGLPQDPEQQSLAFFMTKFAHDKRSEEIWGGCLEALPSLFENAGKESPLAAAATTTAMGSIAWSPGCSGFKTQSIQKYVTSLNRINEALKDPKQSKSDNVLMAVLMLGFYEVCSPSCSAKDICGPESITD